MRYLRSDVEKDINFAREHGFEALVLNSGGVTREKVARLQDAGFEVGVWTVNDEEEMRKFLKLGVTRIYTDKPTLLLEILGE